MLAARQSRNRASRIGGRGSETASTAVVEKIPGADCGDTPERVSIRMDVKNRPQGGRICFTGDFPLGGSFIWYDDGSG